MKAFNFTFIILFIVAAILQYNDSDPYIWIPFYLYAAFLSYQAFLKKYNFGLYYIGLAVYIVYAAYLFFDDTGVVNWIKRHHAESIVRTMESEKPWIEETREFFGLVIVICVLLTNMWWLGKRRSKKKKKFVKSPVNE